jgi:hypothetical protein
LPRQIHCPLETGSVAIAVSHAEGGVNGNDRADPALPDSGQGAFMALHDRPRQSQDQQN